MNAFDKLTELFGRILLAAIFVPAGLNKIMQYEGTQAYMAAHGVPGALLPLVIALEVLGGLAVLVGWQTRVAAIALAVFSLAAAVLFHADFGDQTQMTMFLKNLAIAGGFLILYVHGAGPLSVDARRR